MLPRLVTHWRTISRPMATHYGGAKLPKSHTASAVDKNGPQNWAGRMCNSRGRVVGAVVGKREENIADYDFLVRRSAKSWRQVFRSLCDALGLENLMPYGLRRGGATWLFQQTGNWHLVMEKGRWGHVATAKLYVMPALAAMRDDTLSPHTRELLTAAAVQLQRLRLQLEDRCLEQVGR